MGTLTALFIAATIQFNLPPKLLDSVCFVETGHNIAAIHKNDGHNTDSLGVCQVKLATAREMGFKGTASELMRPKINIFYSAKYLAFQLRRYHGSIRKAVIAYNMGNARGLTTNGYQVKVFTQWRLATNGF